MKKISLELGRPVISAEFKERVIHFLEKCLYYVLQQIIKNEKHLFKIGESKDHDCRCESVRMWSGCFLE